MGALYAAAGVNHFVNPKFYLRIIPPYLPWHKMINYLSGLAEVVLGVGMFIPTYRSFAAWGIIALLIAVFPANLYMYQKGHPKISGKFLFWRLPFQLVLIAWAWLYT